MLPFQWIWTLPVLFLQFSLTDSINLGLRDKSAYERLLILSLVFATSALFAIVISVTAKGPSGRWVSSITTLLSMFLFSVLFDHIAKAHTDENLDDKVWVDWQGTLVAFVAAAIINITVRQRYYHYHHFHGHVTAHQSVIPSIGPFPPPPPPVVPSSLFAYQAL